MNQKEVRERIEEACARLYGEQWDLISTRTNERTIVGYLADYLRPLFGEWTVDTEYNREGGDGAVKRDETGALIPDIIIHTRGQRRGPNLVAVEIKGYWNREDRGFDEEKLRRIGAEYGYRYLFRLELGAEAASLIPIEPISPRVGAV